MRTVMGWFSILVALMAAHCASPNQCEGAADDTFCSEVLGQPAVCHDHLCMSRSEVVEPGASPEPPGPVLDGSTCRGSALSGEVQYRGAGFEIAASEGSAGKGLAAEAILEPAHQEGRWFFLARPQPEIVVGLRWHDDGSAPPIVACKRPAAASSGAVECVNASGTKERLDEVEVLGFLVSLGEGRREVMVTKNGVEAFVLEAGRNAALVPFVRFEGSRTQSYRQAIDIPLPPPQGYQPWCQAAGP